MNTIKGYVPVVVLTYAMVYFFRSVVLIGGAGPTGGGSSNGY